MSDYDEDGMFHGERTTMRTWSGRRVKPLDLQPEDVNVADIAHALARQCRFNGHCDGFISVAGHCVRVHDILVDEGNHDLAPWGLLHDAAETWLGDIIRPMKYSGQFQTYFDAEERIERVLAEVFELEWPMPAEVKIADSKAAVWELEHGWKLVGSPQMDERLFLERFRRYWT